jgi:Na+/H+-dicarboxylate symporter
MLRTAVNVTGDSVVTCVVARTEGALDLEVFNDPKASAQTAGARTEAIEV